MPVTLPEEIGYDFVERAAPAERKTLMVVDDEAGAREALRMIFKDEYDLLLAESGEQALDLAHQHSVDAVVLDIRMAGMSGIEVLQRLKQMDASIEVIMLTAFETLETARQALRLGACDYLDKPFEIGTIRSAVTTAMERHAFSKAIQAQNAKLLELQTQIQNHQLREEIIRTRDEIYASIIHDINGPLTIISGFIGHINQRLSAVTHLDAEGLNPIRDRLERVARQVASCIEISRRYLSFLRGRNSDETPVSLNQILCDLRELLKTHPSASAHELVLHPLDQYLAAAMNGTDLIQILLNLTVNALQSTPLPHRVEIGGTRLMHAVPVSELKDGPQDRFINRSGFLNRPPLIVLRVQDDGPGIDPEVLARMFEPYFTTKPTGEGTGLGLAIVKRLIQQARGAVHVHSAPGKGATFTVFLPAHVAPPSA